MTMKFIVYLTRNDSQKGHILALCPSSVQKRTEKSIVRVSAVDASDDWKKDYSFQVFHHHHHHRHNSIVSPPPPPPPPPICFLALNMNCYLK